MLDSLAKLTWCAFCERATPEPILDDWLPFYWDALLKREIYRPVCPDCIRDRLVYDPETGVYDFPVTSPRPPAFLTMKLNPAQFQQLTAAVHGEIVSVPNASHPLFPTGGTITPHWDGSATVTIEVSGDR